jgi:hypothetical protein
MPEATSKPIGTLLDPMERIAEVLFGVIMTLTFTCTLAVETADRLRVRTMLIGALGCNLALSSRRVFYPCKLLLEEGELT